MVLIAGNADARTVRIGVFPAAPLVLVKDGKPTGLFIELAECFAKKLDWQLVFVTGDWNSLLRDLEKGRIDLLPAVGFTKERLSIYDFSKNAVYVDSGVLFTNPGFSLHSVYDLKGKRVAAVRGSTFTTAFSDYIASFGVRCTLVLTSDNRGVMQAIVTGAADAGVCIYSLGTELSREYPVVVTAISFSPVALYFAAPKGKNDDLIAGIDSLMAPMVSNSDSEYSRLYQTWTMPARSRELPVWLLWGMVTLLFLGIVFGSWSFVLKRQVGIKTKHLQTEIAERTLAESQLTKTLAEKETLIRELYHRTKNTMQVINAMLVLQSERYPGNKDLDYVVKNTESRIRSISLVHQMLFKSKDLSHISIKTYITELTRLILESFTIAKDRISLDLQIEDQNILLDTAIPFGLLINELLTNSIRHAFPDNRKGIITLHLSTNHSNTFTVVYSDDGIGVPDSFDFRNQNSLGMKLIYGLAEKQLMGSVSFSNNKGLVCTMEVATDLYTERV